MAYGRDIVSTRKLTNSQKAKLGRRGDSEIRTVDGKKSHVTALEASLIDSYGKSGEDFTKAVGSGTTNPYTGMPEYNPKLPSTLANTNLPTGTLGPNVSTTPIGSSTAPSSLPWTLDPDTSSNIAENMMNFRDANTDWQSGYNYSGGSSTGGGDGLPGNIVIPDNLILDDDDGGDGENNNNTTTYAGNLDYEQILNIMSDPAALNKYLKDEFGLDDESGYAQYFQSPDSPMLGQGGYIQQEYDLAEDKLESDFETAYDRLGLTKRTALEGAERQETALGRTAARGAAAARSGARSAKAQAGFATHGGINQAMGGELRNLAQDLTAGQAGLQADRATARETYRIGLKEAEDTINLGLTGAELDKDKAIWKEQKSITDEFYDMIAMLTGQ